MTAIERIVEIVHTLSVAEQKVLGMLYGFGGHLYHTPEELSLKLGSPLRKIVKIEATALRKLRHPIPRKEIMKALADGEQQIWDALSCSGDLVLKKEIPSKVPERMPGEFLVAINCIIGTVDQWLADHSIETPKAWYRGRFSREQLIGTIGRLEKIHKQIRLPTPVSLLLKVLQVDLDLLLTAVTLADFSNIFKGYFSKSSMGIRVARAVHLHQLMSLAIPQKPFTTGKLAAVYNERHPR